MSTFDARAEAHALVGPGFPAHDCPRSGGSETKWLCDRITATLQRVADERFTAGRTEGRDEGLRRAGEIALGAPAVDARSFIVEALDKQWNEDFTAWARHRATSKVDRPRDTSSEPPPDARDALRDAALTLLLERPPLQKRHTLQMLRWEERISELLARPDYRAWRTRKEGSGER